MRPGGGAPTRPDAARRPRADPGPTRPGRPRADPRSGPPRRSRADPRPDVAPPRAPKARKGSACAEPFRFRGAVGDRTPDLRNAIAALSQLSYSPEPIRISLL